MTNIFKKLDISKISENWSLINNLSEDEAIYEIVLSAIQKYWDDVYKIISLIKDEPIFQKNLEEFKNVFNIILN